jgi:polyhydroxybutyrate depolymerase
MAAPRVRRAALAALALLFVAVAAAGWLIAPEWPLEPPLSGQLRPFAFEHGGRPRSALVYVPAQLAPAPDLVLVLHGSQSSGAQMRRGSGYGFDVWADAAGAVVAYPDGFERHWNDCRRAGPYAANRENVDDVGFLRALADQLARELGVRWDGVLATGISNGGQMALRLALEAPDFATAAAPMAANLPTDDNLDCQPVDGGTAFLLVNGTEDPMNPYAGGDVALFGRFAPRGPVIGSEETAAFFARRAGHEGPPARDALPDADRRDGTRVERLAWRGDGRPPVALLTIVGGGHTVPQRSGRFPRILGRTSRDVDAAEAITAFYAEAKATRAAAR